MQKKNSLTDDELSHVKAALALNRLETRDLQNLALFLSIDLMPELHHSVPWTRILDGLNRFIEHAPAVVLVLPERPQEKAAVQAHLDAWLD